MRSRVESKRMISSPLLSVVFRIPLVTPLECAQPVERRDMPHTFPPRGGFYRAPTSRLVWRSVGQVKSGGEAKRKCWFNRDVQKDEGCKKWKRQG